MAKKRSGMKHVTSLLATALFVSVASGQEGEALEKKGRETLGKLLAGTAYQHVEVAKVRLLICSIDLPALQERPDARQLLAGIQRYMASSAFNPIHELEPGLIQSIV